MIITSFKIFRYSLPLIWPLFFHGRKITAREGLILKLTLDGETQGFGEIAPLPGFSDSGIDECLENLKGVCPVLMKEHFPCSNLEGGFLLKLDKISMYPAVRFGVEMAVLNASAAQRQLPLNKFFSAHAADKVILNGLLPDANDSLELQVQRLLEKGYTLIKVKVEGNVSRDIKLVTAVARAVNHRAQVHVDANQKWSFEDAILFSEKMKGYNIKYIEEPFADTAKIAEFFRKAGIPVALDESLVSRGFDYSKPPEGVRFFVLKPTLLGGIGKVLRIINEAGKSGVQFIISSSFESGIGLFTLAHLAASIGKDVTAGLDTLKCFENDLLKNPPPISEGQIKALGKSVLESDIRIEYLTEVMSF